MGIDQIATESNLIILVVLGLLKLVEHLIKIAMPNRSVLTEVERHNLTALFEMHNVKDDEGRPIWYMPNQVGKQQEKIIELIEGMIKNQRDTAHVLERILDKLGN